MSIVQTKSGFVNIGDAKIYYETAGKGMSVLMIHAGLADNRQWNNEFADLAQSYYVIRYDMRGYGKSEPVAGEFSHLNDLISLLDALEIREPLVIMGCSMGGGLAIDFAWTHPSRVKALILVGAAPSGLELDVAPPPKFADAEKAFEAGNLDLVAEIETQIWFDGTGRTPDQVNQAMGKLLYEMSRIALLHEVKQLGECLPNTETPIGDRLQDLDVPILIIIGSHDTSYILAAANYMEEKIKGARKVIIEDAAHLPNMDQPREFHEIVKGFLAGLSS